MPLRSFILDHLWLKVFSLILATLIWLTIHSNLEREKADGTRRFDRQPVGLMADAAERRAYVPDPARVSVTVRGPRSVIEDLKAEDLRVYVELAGQAGQPGNYPVEVHAPAGVTVVLVAPRTVFVRLAEGR